MIASSSLIKAGLYLLSMVFFLLIIVILSWNIPICFDEGARFLGWCVLQDRCCRSNRVWLAFIDSGFLRLHRAINLKGVSSLVAALR